MNAKTSKHTVGHVFENLVCFKILDVVKPWTKIDQNLSLWLSKVRFDLDLCKHYKLADVMMMIFQEVECMTEALLASTTTLSFKNIFPRGYF